MSFFVAGTLVHTKEGLKPIEQIKAGDLVLSKPESGEGELSYQPVTRTFEYEDREVYFVAWVAITPDSKLTKDRGHVVVTGGHPFWVTQIATEEPEAPDVEYGPDYVPPEYVYRTVNAWMNMEELAVLDRDYKRKGGSMLFNIQLLDGREAYVKHFDKVAQHRDHLDNPDYGVALCKGYDLERDWWGYGPEIRFEQDGPKATIHETRYMGYKYETGVAYRDKESPVHEPADNWWELEDKIINSFAYQGFQPLRSKVYNLEVANNRTYFVGELGVWVHNANCPEDRASTSYPFLL